MTGAISHRQQGDVFLHRPHTWPHTWPRWGHAGVPVVIRVPCKSADIITQASGPNADANTHRRAPSRRRVAERGGGPAPPPRRLTRISRYLSAVLTTSSPCLSGGGWACKGCQTARRSRLAECGPNLAEFVDGMAHAGPDPPKWFSQLSLEAFRSGSARLATHAMA